MMIAKTKRPERTKALLMEKHHAINIVGAQKMVEAFESVLWLALHTGTLFPARFKDGNDSAKLRDDLSNAVRLNRKALPDSFLKDEINDHMRVEFGI